MSREQIEEMTKDVCGHCRSKCSYTYFECEMAIEAAYTAGYSQQEWISVDIDVTGMERSDLMNAFHKINAMMIKMKEKQIGDLAMALTVEHSVMLRFMDRNWATFLSSMEYIKQNIGGQAYGHKDPALEYKKRGVELFNIMIDKIKEDSVSNFMRCQVKIDPPSDTE